jgi:ABC-type nitrate/sulfonate/bicarbonate transport system ATPase subunit
MGEPFIHLAGVKKIYRTRGIDFLAVSEASFDVDAGELVSLVGPSGCGKTTLLKILAGLHSYEAGDVRIGSSAQPFDPSRDIGMVFQQPLLLKWRRVIDNVMLPAEMETGMTTCHGVSPDLREHLLPTGWMNCQIGCLWYQRFQCWIGLLTGNVTRYIFPFGRLYESN